MSKLKYPLVLCSLRFYFPTVSIHNSAVSCKYDKYNFGKKASRRFKNSSNKSNQGKVDFFQLDPLCQRDVRRAEPDVRQKVIENALQDALNAILESRDVPLELQQQSIDLTKVNVSRDSASAIVYWKVEEEEEEKLVEKLLKENVNQIRMILPTYHHLTHTPTINFERDKKHSYLHRLDALFRSCSSEDVKEK